MNARRAFIGLVFLVGCVWAEGVHYPWLERYEPGATIEARIAPPAGCERAVAVPGSFAGWLRGLPLKPGNPVVRLFDGRPKARQDTHAAVVDLDVGARDLQQCADAVIRLRAEYLFAAGDAAAIHFDFTSGDRADWTAWAAGTRPVVTGNRVTWTRSARPDASYANFRRYLTAVFTYAGTYSLCRELRPVPDAADAQGGDVFIQGGFPGHAVIVVDVAVERATGRRRLLLAQSYSPAQEVEILHNPDDAALDPWYAAEFGDTLRTPEWTFRKSDLKRF